MSTLILIVVILWIISTMIRLSAKGMTALKNPPLANLADGSEESLASEDGSPFEHVVAIPQVNAAAKDGTVLRVDSKIRLQSRMEPHVFLAREPLLAKSMASLLARAISKLDSAEDAAADPNLVVQSLINGGIPIDPSVQLTSIEIADVGIVNQTQAAPAPARAVPPEKPTEAIMEKLKPMETPEQTQNLSGIFRIPAASLGMWQAMTEPRGLRYYRQKLRK